MVSSAPNGTCSNCGKPVYRRPQSRPEIVCRDCRNARRVLRPPAVCATCGDPATPGKTYCSVACSARRDGRRDRSARPCEICGTQFNLTYADQRTCSRACGVELRRKIYGFAGSRPPSEKWPSCKIWFRNCAECKRLFVARRPNAVICGKDCRRRRDSRLTSAAIMQRYRQDPAFRDLVISRAQNRHARKLGIGSITTPKALIAYLMERDHGRCQIPDCQFTDRRIRTMTGPGRPSIDHIEPRSHGGQHALENLQLAHYRCNLAKNNRGGGEQLLLIG